MFVFFDVETNGIESKLHRIVQFSAIIVDKNQQMVYNTFVEQEEIDMGITTITHITKYDLEHNSISESEFAEHMYQLLIKQPIMVAHNCQFDMSMLIDLLIRHYGTNVAYTLVSNCNWLDTLTIVRDRYQKGEFTHSLKDCIKKYNLQGVCNSHNALDDAKALFELFKALMIEKPNCLQYLNVFGFHPYYGLNGVEYHHITYKPQESGLKDDDDILPLQ